MPVATDHSLSATDVMSLRKDNNMRTGFYRWSMVTLLVSFFDHWWCRSFCYGRIQAPGNQARTLTIVKSCHGSNVGSASLLFTLPSCVSGAHDHVNPPPNLTSITSTSLSLKVGRCLIFVVFLYF